MQHWGSMNRDVCFTIKFSTLLRNLHNKFSSLCYNSCANWLFKYTNIEMFKNRWQIYGFYWGLKCPLRGSLGYICKTLWEAHLSTPFEMRMKTRRLIVENYVGRGRWKSVAWNKERVCCKGAHYSVMNCDVNFDPKIKRIWNWFSRRCEIKRIGCVHESWNCFSESKDSWWSIWESWDLLPKYDF